MSVAEIRTECLQNTSRKSHYLRQLFRWYHMECNFNVSLNDDLGVVVYNRNVFTKLIGWSKILKGYWKA
jgi:hypothetical protein